MNDTPICPKCNGKMSLYYGAWCPKCDKPEVESIESLNFVQVLDYMGANDRPGIRDRLWEHYEYDIKNDSYFTLYLDDETINELKEDEFQEDLVADLEAIKKTFNLGDSVTMFVSW